MGIFTDARQEEADKFNAARQRTVEAFLSQTYYQEKASQDLVTRVSTETAEDYVLRQEGYRSVIESLREQTGEFRDDYSRRYERSGDTLYLVTATLLDKECAYLDFCLRMVEENCLRAADASFYANRLGTLMRNVRKDWLERFNRQSDLPEEVRRFIHKLS